MPTCCHCEELPHARDAADGTGTRTWDWMRVAFAGLVAAQSMIFGLAVNLSPPAGRARLVLHLALALSALIVFALVGWPLLRAAATAALKGWIVFEQLFMLGILGAFGASIHSTLTGEGHVYYEVVAILLTIYTFGRIIGERRRSAALDAARALGREFETCEKLLADGSVVTTPVAAIRPGDVVLAPAGGGIPIDGVVVDGVAFVDESSLTGEPFPVVRRAGDSVHAGCHAVDQALKIQATSAGTDRRLDDVLSRVRLAQAGASHIQREADRLVAWFLPVVMLASLATFAAWTAHEGWVAGLFNALAVILVACPCSMGLATPIGIWSALADLARRGVVANTSDLVEQLAKVDAVVFDKTGTLGEETVEIIDFVSAPGIDRESLITEVAAVESTSGHPIARAFRSSVPMAFAREISVIPGGGIQGWVEDDLGGAHLAVGNTSIVPAAGRAAAESLKRSLRGADAASHEVYILRDGKVAGIALLRERLRASARAVISELESAGITCAVLTGDRAEAAAVHGLPNVHAGLSPADKVERMRAIAGNRRALYVGDGVNDAPAMAWAAASLSIATGSPLARQTAMGEVLGGDLASIPYAIARSRAAIRAIRHNVYFAAAYNVIGIGLAAAGILHPVAAALLMLASSFTVTWRALRALRGEPTLARPRTLPRPPARDLAGSGALCAGIAVQGPVIAHLGAFQGMTAAGFVALFAAAAAVAFFWLRRRRFERQAEMALGMFSLGGVAMLAGWWADAGFGAVVRDGVCLCGCANSAMGLGIFAKANWMSAGMVVASLPALALESRETRRWSARLGCWLVGLGGMLVGMQGAAWLMAQLPTTNPQVHFFATYGAMAFGMVLGMTAACGAWNRMNSRR